MTITEARSKMEAKRKKAQKLLDEAKELRDWIIKKGGDPYPQYAATRRRNLSIFKQYNSGKSLDELSKKHGIKPATVLTIYYKVKFRQDRGIKY